MSAQAYLGADIIGQRLGEDEVAAGSATGISRQLLHAVETGLRVAMTNGAYHKRILHLDIGSIPC